MRSMAIKFLANYKIFLLGISAIFLQNNFGRRVALREVAVPANATASRHRGALARRDATDVDLQHPYTRLLRESIPEADPTKRWDTSVALSDTEVEEYLREGCKFAGRCPHVMEICRATIPADLQVGGVLVKCHLYSMKLLV
jgi:oligopeptide/dipeptide ABC transporter ATP-binding protein